ncbi:MAG: polysaccharide export protein [Robiginitomaculum sp.]|nr:MAG: polysaccharide export protein [Robiginitomaculum sp.]
MRLIFSPMIALCITSMLVGCVGPEPTGSARYGSQVKPTKKPNNFSQKQYYSSAPNQSGQFQNAQQPQLRRNSFQSGQFRTWVDSDPIYRLLPGDQLNVFVYSAPELNQTLIVGPDGRVVMPLAQPVMAANLSIEQLEQKLRQALSSQLVDPELELSPLTYGSQRIFIGGDVVQGGIFELPGQIGVMEAVFMAGGFTNTAKTKQVVLVRRHPSGMPMMKVIDVRSVLRGKSHADTTPLQRGDVIYVPRSTIGNINLFMQQYIRDALPITFGLTYNIGQQF